MTITLDTSDKVLLHYESELAINEQQLDNLRRKDNNLSRLRLFLIIVVIYFIYAIQQSSEFEPLNYLGLAAFCLIFAYVWRYHGEKQEQLKLTQITIEQFNQGINRIKRDWDKLKPVPHKLNTSQTILDHDLNLYGHGSIGQLIFNMSPAIGDSQLATWLNNPGTVGEIKHRQEAVTELTQNIGFCHKLTNIAERGKTHAAFIAKFKSWASTPIENHKAWIVVARLSTLAMVASIIGAVYSKELIIIPIMLLAINALVTAMTAKKNAAVFQDLEGVHQAIDVLKTLSQKSLNQGFSTGLLLKQTQLMKAGDNSAPMILSILQRILFQSQLRFNGLAYLVMQMLFLWDSHVLHYLVRWKKENGQIAEQTTEALATIEALSSLAIVSFENPQWCMPDLCDTKSQTIDIKSAGNPLIPNDKCVTNDILLTPEQRLVIVTGSNMSGKTTYMRTLGLNVKLALTGSVVFAKEMTIPNLSIVSSMHVADALHEGKSYFMSELLQLKHVIEAANSADEKTVLYLLDEVLKGTNNHDKKVATVSVLQALLSKNTVGMLTTHDIDIANAPELKDNSEQLYFQEVIDTSVLDTDSDNHSPLSFDFKAKQGVLEKTNALKLVKLLGIIDDR